MKPVERLNRLRTALAEALDTMDFGDATAAVEYAEEHLAAAIQTLTEEKEVEHEHS
jgi:hypothetical protein